MHDWRRFEVKIEFIEGGRLKSYLFMFKMAKRSALLRARIGPTVAAFRPSSAQRWSLAPRGKSDWLELGGYAYRRWGDGWYWVFDSLGYDMRQSKGRKRRLHWVAPGSSCDRQPAADVPPPLSVALAGVDRGWSKSPPCHVSLFFEKLEGASAPFWFIIIFFSF